MRKYLVAVIALVLGVAMSTAAFGAGYELKISTTQTETSMIYAGLQAAADEIMAKTNGDLKVTIYPSSQLGGEEDMIDQAIAGIGVAVLTDAGRMSSYVKDIGIFNMAYFVDNYDDGLKVMGTNTFKGWTDELVGQGIRVLCFNYYDGARSFMQNKEIKTPAELKGLVTRTPGAAPYNASIKAMGATPYNIAWSEVYNAIQTKMIDACEVQYTSAVSTHIYEVCKFVTKTEHINLFNCLICGEAWFSKLPDNYKQIVLEACYNNALVNARAIEAAQADMEKTLVDNGMTITKVDKGLFKDAAAAAYAELGWTELRQAIYKEAGL
ncbi:MAG: C4-dicarboxylate TRAP transporter substrate-binding protein [Fretibacterium sp.]|nr:C4-dicarboxylate TRAP transporter substrate-binding protein [Fretibacterium sp.]